MTGPTAKGPRPVVLVTGLSGAGKASILRTLEDLGFETVDNPPLTILDELVADGATPIAIGVDARSRGFQAAEVLNALGKLRARHDIATSLVFATADDAVLLRRFSETRRRHPLAPGGSLGSRVAEGIAREAALLAGLPEAADLLVDTSDLPLPELRRLIERRFRPEGAAGLDIAIISFAYPKGLPREADLVFDMRFLRNPHYDPVLRPMTGRDAPVAAFVEADADFAPFWARMTGLLELLLPRYAAEGKKYLAIAVGCTGGRHRSVLVAERLAAHLEARGRQVDVVHRELAPAPAPNAGGGASQAGREALAHSS
ncbi:RNase adapter RapZ [Falsiroseomonas sp.]|uniref:RNase adapter RapZ n=1 Tax=Falsiroseomonas sp. TaxID=2870721 RepID=UPI00356727A0